MSKEPESQAATIKLYTPFPFPNCSDRKLDEFESAAWAALQKDWGSAYVRTVERNAKTVVRAPIANKMVVDACVSGHTSHPQTPKSGSPLGDGRGVLEVNFDTGLHVSG